MAWTNPSDKSTGDVVTAAIWNASLGTSGNMAQTAAAKVTTAGDIVYATAANTLARLGIGSSAQVLTVSGGVPAWAAAAGGFALAGSNTTEATMTSATAADMVTISGLSIPATTPFMIMFNARKSAGTSASMGIGLKINSTIVYEAVNGTGRLATLDGINEVESGTVMAYIGPRYTNYLYGVITGAQALSGAAAANPSLTIPRVGATADFPNATITSLAIRGDSDGTNTLGIQGVFVYTLPVS